MQNSLVFRLLISILTLVSVTIINAQQLTLEDLWLKGSFRSSMVYDVTWDASGNYSLSTKITKDSFAIVATSFNETKDWLSLPNINNFESFVLSNDTNLVALLSQEEPIYRRSSKYYVHLYIKSKKEFITISDSVSGKISNLSFSPQGNKLAYCRNNNLYIWDFTTRKEIAITTDGKWNEIIHGSTDWVYEEEFEFAKAYVWSADGSNIAWYRFDESQVKEYNLQYFYENYPTDYRFKYPKAGEKNSVVRLMVYSLSTKQTHEFTPQKETDLYYPRLFASNDPNYLILFELNRNQNHLKIHRYSISTQKTELMYEEKNSSYIEINDFVHFLPSSSSFVFTSERSGFRHIWKIEMGKTPKALTQGNWEVLEIFGITPDGKKMYFASNSGKSYQQKIGSYEFKSGKTSYHENIEGWNAVIFNPQLSAGVFITSNVNTPPVCTLKSLTNKKSKVWIENKTLRSTITNLGLPKIEFSPITIDTVELNAWILKPKTFDASKKYPVLLTVYGGPGHMSVTNQWMGYNYFWYQILADQGYIVMGVDGRGTGGKGVAFKKCTQGKLGQQESDDMIAVANYLKGQSFVDGSRIGIFGWSFGGYLSAFSLAKGKEAFKAAIAVAPVTDWKWYDNIYTERYMGTPAQNPEGYAASSVLNYAGQLNGNLLLVHGTGDDNVHFQHSLGLQEALVNSNKQFQQFFYANKNHGIYGGYTRYHLYKMMTDFILKNL